jgi:hypothetical protein
MLVQVMVVPVLELGVLVLVLVEMVLVLMVMVMIMMVLALLARNTSVGSDRWCQMMECTSFMGPVHRSIVLCTVLSVQ